MSLKAFHIAFVTVALTFSLGFGIWGLHDARVNGNTLHLWLGIASLVIGGLLIPYAAWFLRKTKGEGYL